MFSPHKSVTCFHSNLLLDNCKFHITKDVSKVEGRRNSADADKPRDAFRGQSMLPNTVSRPKSAW